MNKPPCPGLSVYTAKDGDVLRDGMYLGMVTATRLLERFQADPEPHAQYLAGTLGAAIREAQSYSESEAA